MEGIVEALLVCLLELAGPLLEFLLSFAFEILAELGVRMWKAPVRPAHPVVAGIGYALVGGGLGGLSAVVVPSLVLQHPALAIAHFVLSPLAAGLLMAGIGALRRRRGEALVRLDSFAYGWLFAAAFASVRLALAA